MNIDFEKHRVQFEHTMLGFVEAELEMARTFCFVARAASSPEKRSRNLENAKIAYRSALDALEHLSGNDAKMVLHGLLKDVERELLTLGDNRVRKIQR